MGGEEGETKLKAQKEAKRSREVFNMENVEEDSKVE
jgi:hypothetical protein